MESILEALVFWSKSNAKSLIRYIKIWHGDILFLHFNEATLKRHQEECVFLQKTIVCTFPPFKRKAHEIHWSKLFLWQYTRLEVTSYHILKSLHLCLYEDTPIVLKDHCVTCLCFLAEGRAGRSCKGHILLYIFPYGLCVLCWVSLGWVDKVSVSSKKNYTIISIPSYYLGPWALSNMLLNMFWTSIRGCAFLLWWR